MNEIQDNGIKIYTGETDDDDDDNPEIKELKVCLVLKKRESKEGGRRLRRDGDRKRKGLRGERKGGGKGKRRRGNGH